MPKSKKAFAHILIEGLRCEIPMLVPPLSCPLNLTCARFETRTFTAFSRVDERA